MKMKGRGVMGEGGYREGWDRGMGVLRGGGKQKGKSIFCCTCPCHKRSSKNTEKGEKIWFFGESLRVKEIVIITRKYKKKFNIRR